jgi:hypothetical protein
MSILEDYITEAELAAETDKTVRMLQKWRQLRVGPPWTKFGKQVIYRRAAVNDWLRSLEQQPVRNRRTA